MEIKIDRKNRLPIHSQLQAQLVHLIQTRRLSAGTRLPTVRQLAGFLRINRNTVAKVFAEMEREGYLECIAGKGTFVAAAKRESKKKLERVQELLTIVDEAIQRAKKIGFSPEDLSLTLFARTQTAESEVGPKPGLLFVECNESDTDLFRTQLEEELGQKIDSMLLEALSQKVAEDRDFFNRYHIIVTTFYHIRDVQTIIDKQGIEVFGLMPDTSVGTLMRLMALPEGTVLGIACHSSVGTENIKLSIERAGLKHLRVVTGAGDRKESLAEMIKASTVVVCSSLIEKEVRAIPGAEKREIIVEYKKLEQAGIDMLRSRLAEINTSNLMG
jgi:DNA-binding transcriptional regulator YhcF (GntR family)